MLEHLTPPAFKQLIVITTLKPPNGSATDGSPFPTSCSHLHNPLTTTTPGDLAVGNVVLSQGWE